MLGGNLQRGINMEIKMNYRCPGCGVTMEFDPATQKLHCEFCKSSYTVRQLEAILAKQDAGVSQYQADEAAEEASDGDSVAKSTAKAATGDAADGADDKKTTMETAGADEELRDTIPMTILHCNSCGAELAIDGTEASTFCAFCGQAAVVTDRLEGWLKPDYIIPFKVTKQKAEETIRTKLSKGFFVPREFRNFETDCLRGIYIPYWLFDVYYGDTQYWKYEHRKNQYHSETKHACRSADCTFYDMTLDASTHVPDGSSQRLEPYDMNELKPFDAAYLSGFYSNRYDITAKQLEELSLQRAADLFDESIEKDVKSRKNLKHAKKYSSDPIGKALNPRYALLPAWFLTTRACGAPRTILVNGQTGKMVGAVPFVKWKAYVLFALLAVLFSTPLILLSIYALPLVFNLGWDVEEKMKMTYYIAVGCGLLIAFFWRSVWKKVDAMQKSRSLTESEVTSRFASERQEK